MRLLHRRAFSSHAETSTSYSQRLPVSLRPLAPFRNSTSLHPQPSLPASGRTDPTALRPNAAQSSATSPTSQPQPTIVPLPASQQDAVEAAVSSLLPPLQPLLSTTKPPKTAKGFSSTVKPGLAANRFAIEIPVLDPSPQATIDLTTTLITTIGAQLKQRGGAAAATAAAPANWTVVQARDDVVQHHLTRSGNRGGGGGRVVGLRQACQQPQLGGLLVVVEPALSDLALVEQLLDEVWGGPAVVLLNPQWGQQGALPPPGFESLIRSITVVYSFMPVAIQGLLGRKEGAVLRSVEPGVPVARAPWRILLQQPEGAVQVGAMTRRPTSSDLELAFLNAAAASSPLTKTAKFLKGLIPKGEKK